MPRWQPMGRELLQAECIISFALLLLAALLITAAIRLLTFDTAQLGKMSLADRVARVTQQARHDGCAYTVKLIPDSSEVHIIRWLVRHADDGSLETEPMRFTHRLPAGVWVAHTTMPRDELAISERGRILVSGEILLHAPDGSRATLAIGPPAHWAQQKSRRQPVWAAAD